MLQTVPPRRRTGAQPPGEFVTTSIRFPASTYQALSALADRELRSFNAEVVYIVQQYLAEHTGERPIDAAG